MRAARAEIDLAAVAENVQTLVELVRPAQVCAVVKADGYGHGAIAVSEAALAAGASWLGVALVEEGAVLRKAGIDAPILLLSQPRPADVRDRARLRPAAHDLHGRRHRCHGRRGSHGRNRAGSPEGRHGHEPGGVPTLRRVAARQGDRPASTRSSWKRSTRIVRWPMSRAIPSPTLNSTASTKW